MSKNVWFELQGSDPDDPESKPTDSGTVFVKPPRPASEATEAASQPGE
jgi:hypothetical protein